MLPKVGFPSSTRVRKASQFVGVRFQISACAIAIVCWQGLISCLPLGLL